jgi:hypothetical protein
VKGREGNVLDSRDGYGVIGEQSKGYWIAGGYGVIGEQRYV